MTTTTSTRVWLFLTLLTLCMGAHAGPAMAIMAALPAWAPAAATIFGTVMGASAAISSGNAQQGQAESQAQQLDVQAGQDRATAQRKAMEDRRQARLGASRVQALAGGGGTDESVLDLTGRIAGEGEYNALTSLYDGEETARGKEFAATNARASGAAAAQAGRTRATANILSGAGSLFSKYGNGGVGGGSFDPIGTFMRGTGGSGD